MSGISDAHPGGDRPPRHGLTWTAADRRHAPGVAPGPLGRIRGAGPVTALGAPRRIAVASRAHPAPALARLGRTGPRWSRGGSGRNGLGSGPAPSRLLTPRRRTRSPATVGCLGPRGGGRFRGRVAVGSRPGRAWSRPAACGPRRLCRARRSGRRATQRRGPSRRWARQRTDRDGARSGPCADGVVRAGGPPWPFALRRATVGDVAADPRARPPTCGPTSGSWCWPVATAWGGAAAWGDSG